MASEDGVRATGRRTADGDRGRCEIGLGDRGGDIARWRVARRVVRDYAVVVGRRGGEGGIGVGNRAGRRRSDLGPRPCRGSRAFHFIARLVARSVGPLQCDLSRRQCRRGEASRGIGVQTRLGRGARDGRVIGVHGLPVHHAVCAHAVVVDGGGGEPGAGPAGDIRSRGEDLGEARRSSLGALDDIARLVRVQGRVGVGVGPREVDLGLRVRRRAQRGGGE